MPSTNEIKYMLAGAGIGAGVTCAVSLITSFCGGFGTMSDRDQSQTVLFILLAAMGTAMGIGAGIGYAVERCVDRRNQNRALAEVLLPQHAPEPVIVVEVPAPQTVAEAPRP